MSDVTLAIGTDRYRVLNSQAVDISIPLDFAGPQPNHFGAPRARAVALEAGDFVGDTREGGSCNCETLVLTPHCNGTHTECIGHVTGERISVADRAREALIGAALLSTGLVSAESCGERADPMPQPGDQLVTAAELERAATRLGGAAALAGVHALVLRTLPNEADKASRDYDDSPMPAFLTLDAMRWVVELGVRHLLVDLPSVDRSHDQGRLSAHREFWGLAPGATKEASASRPDATITEMVFAADTVADGLYALSLQIAPFVTDAAPSRPLLFPLEAA